MKNEAQNKINQVLTDVWGFEFVEDDFEEEIKRKTEIN
jgi:hypothetical protein